MSIHEFSGPGGPVGARNKAEQERQVSEETMGKAMADTKRMSEGAGGMGAGLVNKCPKGVHNPKESQLVFCCKHTLDQDEYHPVGIYYVPFKYGSVVGMGGYYLCPACLRQQERGALNLGESIISACYGCVNDEGTRIAGIDPQKIKDLRVHRLDEKRPV